MAGALGRYDWGRHSGPFPVFERIARADVLNDVLTELAGSPSRGAPRLLALTGFSGAGKSTLAVSFAELTATRYDRLVWFDATSDASIAAQALMLLGENAIAPSASSTEAAAALRDVIAESTESWLLIFDNASSARQLQQWIPPFGHVDVLATTTAATKWSTWRQLPIPAMETEDALELVRVRLQLQTLADEDHLEHAAMLVVALDNWPLAIELACSYLTQSGRRLSITPEYVARVKDRIIDDEDLMSPAYRSHRTLLQAVMVAIDTVSSPGKPTYPKPLAPADVLDVLAYLPPRQAPARLAASAAHLRAKRLGLLEEAASMWRDLEIWLDDVFRHLSRTSLISMQPSAILGPCIRMNSIVADVIRKRQDDDTVTQVLDSLQVVLGEALRKSHDSEDYLLGKALVASCTNVLGRALQDGRLTLDGLVTIGNMANFAMLVGAFRDALGLFELELSILQAENPKAFLLRANIDAAMLYCQWSLDADLTEMQALLEDSVRACEMAVAADERSTSVLAATAKQIVEVLWMLRASGAPEQRGRVDDWLQRLSRLGFLVEQDAWTVLVGELNDHGNDNEATLRRMSSELERPLGVRERLYLMFAVADALAMLRRYGEAEQSFVEAIEESRSHGLGLGLGWVSILNAWRGGSFTILGVRDDANGAQALCATLDDLVGDDLPDSEADRVSLALCRSATWCETASADVVDSCIQAITRATETRTLRGKDVSKEGLIEGACREIVRMRRQLRWASIIGLGSWGRARLDGLPIYIIGALSDVAASAQGDLNLLHGQWVVSDFGVGLHVDAQPSVLVWRCTRETGWLAHSEARELPEVARLRELVTTGAAVPTPAALIPESAFGADVSVEALEAATFVLVTDVLTV